jgi:hypothetical protein
MGADENQIYKICQVYKRSHGQKCSMSIIIVIKSNSHNFNRIWEDLQVDLQ